MGETIVKAFFLLLIISFIGGLVYKAINPNNYQDPRYRSSK